MSINMKNEKRQEAFASCRERVDNTPPGHASRHVEPKARAPTARYTHTG